MEPLLDQPAARARIPEDDEENPFKRLPDELISSHILNKFPEPKSLFLISTVTKHFSSLVFQSHDVSIIIPPPNPDFQELNSTEQPTRNPYLLSLLRKVVHFLIVPLRLLGRLFCSVLKRLLPGRFPPLSPASDSEDFPNVPINFLAKFTSMRSLYLEFDNSGPGGLIASENEPLVRWRIHPKSTALMFFYCRNFLDLDQENLDIDALFSGYFEDCHSEMLAQMEIAISWVSLLQELVLVLPESLKEAVITDSKKQGKMDPRGEDIDYLRKGDIDFEDPKGRLRYWFKPLLKLPSSGSVLKMVFVMMGKESETDYDDCLIAKEVFCGEDEEFLAEAAMEMVKMAAFFEHNLTVDG